MPFFLDVVRIHLQITVMLLLLFSYKVTNLFKNLFVIKIYLYFLKIYTLIKSREKPSNQSNLLNFSGSLKDGDQKNSSVVEETEKERELKVINLFFLIKFIYLFLKKKILKNSLKYSVYIDKLKK